MWGEIVLVGFYAAWTWMLGRMGFIVLRNAVPRLKGWKRRDWDAPTWAELGIGLSSAGSSLTRLFWLLWWAAWVASADAMMALLQSPAVVIGAALVSIAGYLMFAHAYGMSSSRPHFARRLLGEGAVACLVAMTVVAAIHVAGG